MTNACRALTGSTVFFAGSQELKEDFPTDDSRHWVPGCSVLGWSVPLDERLQLSVEVDALATAGLPAGGSVMDFGRADVRLVLPRDSGGPKDLTMTDEVVAGRARE